MVSKYDVHGGLTAPRSLLTGLCSQTVPSPAWAPPQHCRSFKHFSHLLKTIPCGHAPLLEAVSSGLAPPVSLASSYATFPLSFLCVNWFFIQFLANNRLFPVTTLWHVFSSDLDLDPYPPTIYMLNPMWYLVLGPLGGIRKIDSVILFWGGCFN